MKPLVNKKFKLEKFEGKGGWTYARLPSFIKRKVKGFGWTKVKGSIDSVKISKMSLMPMGDGNIFLPVKAEIRKKIGKEAGDIVTVILYPDNDPLKIPDEMLLCLQDEPAALTFFDSLSESERNFYITWVYTAKREETRIDRLAKTINRLSKRLKMYDRSEPLS